MGYAARTDWPGAAALTLCGVLFLAATVAAGAQTPPPKKDDAFQVSAPYAILVDADSGTVLFEKNADKLNPPASMSKLMTTEVVLHAIAEGIAGSELAFADMMNKRAKELGLTQANFTNSTGLHEAEHKMTARELAKLAQHIVKTYPEAYKIYGEREFTWNKVRQQNRNPLLAMNIGADGLKTGYTKEAGYGLVASAVNNGLRLIMVVNGFKTMKERADEARKLMEWGFRAFEARALFAQGETVGEAKLYGGAQGKVALVSPIPIRLLVPRAMSEKLSAKITYAGPVPAPVTKGQPIGTLKVSRGENVVLEVPLQAGEDVGGGALHQRAFDAMGELVINVFRAGVDRL